MAKLYHVRRIPSLFSFSGDANNDDIPKFRTINKKYYEQK